MVDLPQEVQDVLAERERHLALGYTPEHDDAHGAGWLAVRGHDYLNRGIVQGNRSDLVAAAAMILASIATLDRLASFEGKPTDG